MCQLALSQINTHTLWPSSSSFREHHSKKSTWLSCLPDARPRTAAMSFRARACTVRSKRRPSDRGRLFRETAPPDAAARSEEHTSELQSRQYLVCRLLLEKKKIAFTSCIHLNPSH